jgi:predicted HTH transcriptional regulator
MKKNLFVLGIFILLIHPIFAANFTYTIIGEKTLVEIEMNESEVELFSFPENFEYSNEKIKYISSNLVEKNNQEYFFIAKEKLHKNSFVEVILPESAIVTENYLLFPNNYSFRTNGKNIIIEWKNSEEKEILIQYKINKNSYWIYFILAFFALGGIYFYFIKKQNKKDKYTRNLFGEEKKIMKYLINKKECWTKDLVKDLEIPKVRLSRKIRKLVEKGLVEKIPYGNENKIKLK